jgi:DNA-directed RNA polymerase specialized sigma24 family protein
MLRLTDEQRQTISELREAGMSYRGIANHVGKNYETVRTFCNRKAKAIPAIAEKPIDPGDIWGLWNRAMQTVRAKAL